MKAQLSAEFLIVVGALLAIFLIFYTVAFGQNINLAQTRDALASLRNAYALSAAINYVHLAGNGARYNLTLTGRGGNENITITNLTVQSVRTHSSSRAPLLNGGTNTSSVNATDIVIKNNKGLIEIEQ